MKLHSDDLVTSAKPEPPAPWAWLRASQEAQGRVIDDDPEERDCSEDVDDSNAVR